jgi:hypothetical protein
MKVLSASVVVACALFLLFPGPATANEYQVLVNADWLLGSIEGGNCIDCTQADYDAFNVVVGQFTGSFDMYGNGMVVPGSASETVSGDLDENSQFSFTYSPVTLPLTSGYGIPTDQTITFSGLTWYNQRMETISLDLPIGLPSSGIAVYDWNCGTFGFPNERTCGIDGGGQTPLVLDCYSFSCSFEFHCYDPSCPTGGDTPADAGSIVISEIAAPEPRSISLLLSGMLSCFGLRVWRKRGT